MTSGKRRLLDITRYLGGWPAPVGLLLLIGLHFFGGLPYQDILRTLSFDLYQIAQPRERISAPVIIVDIDEDSLRQYGQWPWPRSLLAQRRPPVRGIAFAPCRLNPVDSKPIRQDRSGTGQD